VQIGLQHHIDGGRRRAAVPALATASAAPTPTPDYRRIHDSRRRTQLGASAATTSSVPGRRLLQQRHQVDRERRAKNRHWIGQLERGLAVQFRACAHGAQHARQIQYNLLEMRFNGDGEYVLQGGKRETCRDRAGAVRHAPRDLFLVRQAKALTRFDIKGFDRRLKLSLDLHAGGAITTHIERQISPHDNHAECHGVMLRDVRGVLGFASGVQPVNRTPHCFGDLNECLSVLDSHY
jgi:hypothetical protein